MKNMIVFSLRISPFAVVLLFFPTCQALDGLGIPPDFQKKEWKLNGEEQSITLRSKNNVDWFLYDLAFNGDVLLDMNGWEADSRIVVYSSKEKNLEYPHIYNFGVYRIEFEDWFVWERFGNTKIKIQLTKNTTGIDREIRFEAFAGNASDYIRIVQKAK